MATNEDAARSEAERLKTDREDAKESAETSSPLQGLKAIGIAARRLFGNWRALLILLLLYSVMLASLYFFIAVREASVWQVMATFLLAALIPVIFFVIQAIGVRYSERDVRTKDLLRWSVRDFWKLLVATIPLLLLAWLLAYLFSKFQVNVPAAATGAEATAAAAARPAAVPTAAELFSWKEVLLTTLRFLIFGLVLPLIAIHLWIAAARRGLKGAFRNAGRVLAGALAPGAALVYAIGLLLFGVIPYFLITTTYTRGGAWTQLTLLGTRLLLASLFMLFGWLVTLGALSIISPDEKITERAILEEEAAAAETNAAEAKASEPVVE
ncbi:MAG TPA: hypothetical protein VM911_20510 [Pyrinomonadaceae bacterium]|jgi:hypothetical protein|nr:hypothetical protein [Pyrinomonadaceae bacterium]